MKEKDHLLIRLNVKTKKGQQCRIFSGQVMKKNIHSQFQIEEYKKRKVLHKILQLKLSLGTKVKQWLGFSVGLKVIKIKTTKIT